MSPLRALASSLALCAAACGPGTAEPPRSTHSGTGDSSGVTGIGTTESETGAPTAPRTVVSLFAGVLTTCVIFDTGAARCWGINRVDEEYFGDDEPASMVPDLALPKASVSIAIGLLGICAITLDQELTCWGINEFGQLGAPNQLIIGDDEPLGTPVDLDAPAFAVATYLATCVALTDGRMRCFGLNGLGGYLGLGTTESCLGCAETANCCIGNDEPVLSVPALEFPQPVRSLSVGSHATCAVLEGGELRCWGGYYMSEPSVGIPGLAWGDDELASMGPPVEVGGPVAQVATVSHTCAVLVDGGVRCWGPGSHGELGQGNTDTIGYDQVPASVPTIPLPGPAAEVRVGGRHTCARLVDGSVWCWGDGAQGQLGHPGIGMLGDDEPIDSVGPVDIGGTAVALASGHEHNCVLLDTGRLRCWGANGGGQLGYGHTDRIGDDETPASAGDVPLE